MFYGNRGLADACWSPGAFLYGFRLISSVRKCLATSGNRVCDLIRSGIPAKSMQRRAMICRGPVPPPSYLALEMVALPVFVFLPMHLLLGRLYGRQLKVSQCLSAS